MQNRTGRPQRQKADDEQRNIHSKRTMLNLQLLGLTAFHLVVLTGWIWLSSMAEINHDVLFGLLILTASTWFWLIVIARRRLALTASSDQGNS